VIALLWLSAAVGLSLCRDCWAWCPFLVSVGCEIGPLLTDGTTCRSPLKSLRQEAPCVERSAILWAISSRRKRACLGVGALRRGLAQHVTAVAIRLHIIATTHFTRGASVQL